MSFSKSVAASWYRAALEYNAFNAGTEHTSPVPVCLHLILQERWTKASTCIRMLLKVGFVLHFQLKFLHTRHRPAMRSHST